MTLTEYRRRWVYQCLRCGLAGHLRQHCTKPAS